MSRSSIHDITSNHGTAQVGVLIVEDKTAVRDRVSQLLASAQIPIREIRAAANCDEARRLASLLCPEVVVLDVDLGDEDGLTLIGQLGPSARVVVFTSHTDLETRVRALRLGAHKYIEKHQPASDLIQAVVDLATPRTGGDKTPSQAGASSPARSVASSDALAPKRK